MSDASTDTVVHRFLPKVSSQLLFKDCAVPPVNYAAFLCDAVTLAVDSMKQPADPAPDINFDAWLTYLRPGSVDISPQSDPNSTRHTEIIVPVTKIPYESRRELLSDYVAKFGAGLEKRHPATENGLACEAWNMGLDISGDISKYLDNFNCHLSISSGRTGSVDISLERGPSRTIGNNAFFIPALVISSNSVSSKIVDPRLLVARLEELAGRHYNLVPYDFSESYKRTS